MNTKLRHTIEKVIVEEINDKKNKLLKLIHRNGVLATAKMVGSYERLLRMVDYEIPDDLKIQDIREVVEKNGQGIYFPEDNLDFIYYKTEKDGDHFIEYLGLTRAGFVVIKNDEDESDYETPEEYDIRYIDLESYVLNDICELLLKHYV